ncbi:hypothetical protein DND132_1456 [Pseudodesulfovibrio mercurii]|uniref:Uncharacterized protein n=1 Tax=Pseudodesulfovibrio mercurii TaxID=641491 RepID=F0JE55_9BACT|nr:hypothetical protein [Pseudodesulfovibrio mercurii]EGB14664.1 hypothetical protein DND132_1456 [Pseudodesulfovibrio mercurii]
MNKRYNLHTLVLLLVLCLTFLARPAGAGDASLATLADRARQCGVFSETVDRVRAAVASGDLTEADGASLLAPLVEACDRKLPLAPLEDKLEEGLSKHVRPALIVHALKVRINDYAFVAGLLPGPSGKTDARVLVALGEGLSKGATRADVEAYVNEFGGQQPDPFLTGAEMVSLLGQAGFDYALTRTVLKAGFDANALTPEWRYLVRLVLIARQRGVRDPEIAENAVAVLGDGGTLGDLSIRLGFTSRSLTGRTISN